MNSQATQHLQQVKADLEGGISVCQSAWKRVLEIALEQQSHRGQLLGALRIICDRARRDPMSDAELLEFCEAVTTRVTGAAS